MCFRQGGDDADERLPALLHLRGLRPDVEAACWRLLCVLLVCGRSLSAETSGLRDLAAWPHTVHAQRPGSVLLRDPGLRPLGVLGTALEAADPVLRHELGASSLGRSPTLNGRLLRRCRLCRSTSTIPAACPLPIKACHDVQATTDRRSRSLPWRQRVTLRVALPCRRSWVRVPSSALQVAPGSLDSRSWRTRPS